MIDIIELPYPASSFHLFRALRTLPLPVLLHSGNSRDDPETARYDILSAAPSSIIRYQNDELQLESAAGIRRYKTRQPFRKIADILQIREQTGRPENLPFCGGLLGYFAYESQHAAHKVARRQQDGADLPDILAGLYDWALIVDHTLESCRLVSQPMCSRELLAEIQQRLAQAHEAESEAESETAGFQVLSPFQSNFTQPDYARAFARVMHYIHAGDCYQVNLAQCFQAACKGDSFDAFCRLQTLADAPFAAYLEDGDQAVLSFSPERFLRVDRGHVVTQPIKGTRPRYTDTTKDSAALNELRTSNKDRAENLMIVDLLRNDLGKVCRTGSVRVDSLFSARSFRNVHHLISTISGELQRPGDVLPLMEVCFPGGSITGTPKKRAMEIISEVETMPRSVYCGAIAWIDGNGNMDSNIAIRTLVRDRDRLYCWGGGGIVADSQMQDEFQESLDKIALFINALSAEQPVKPNET